MPSSETVPRFLWHLSWAGLAVVITIGVVLAFVLAGGAADPPKAGPLAYQSDTTTNDILLPDGPYTLEVTGHLSASSDPGAVWGVELINPPLTPALSPTQAEGKGDSRERFIILLNGDGFFSVAPFQPDFTPFIHIRTHGESNKLTLDVGNGGQGVLRFNDEIAWKGIIPRAQFTAVRVIGGRQFTLEHIAVYSPATIPR